MTFSKIKYFTYLSFYVLCFNCYNSNDGFIYYSEFDLFKFTPIKQIDKNNLTYPCVKVKKENDTSTILIYLNGIYNDTMKFVKYRNMWVNTYTRNIIGLERIFNIVNEGEYVTFNYFGDPMIVGSDFNLMYIFRSTEIKHENYSFKDTIKDSFENIIGTKYKIINRAKTVSTWNIENLSKDSIKVYINTYTKNPKEVLENSTYCCKIESINWFTKDLQPFFNNRKECD